VISPGPLRADEGRYFCALISVPGKNSFARRMSGHQSIGQAFAEALIKPTLMHEKRHLFITPNQVC